MRLVFFIAFVAAFNRVWGDPETVQKFLSITDAELTERLALVAQIEKLDFWDGLTAVFQERLRHAVVLAKEPPKSWNVITSYDQFILPEYATFLYRITHLDSQAGTNYMTALPKVPHEDAVKAAPKKLWFKSLNRKEQKELSRLILTGRIIPEQNESWEEAINDERTGDWVQKNKEKLKPSVEPSDLQHTLGITDKELKDRSELLSKVQKLALWTALTPVQQERLQHAIILGDEPPKWLGITTYSQLLSPGQANSVDRLNREPHKRDLINSLPRVAHEDVLRTASRKSWWRTLAPEEQKKLSVLILKGKRTPQGWRSWKEAVNDAKLGTWLKDNKSKWWFNV